MICDHLKGKYIVVEGVEGVGKTTQIMFLQKFFHCLEIKTKTVKEPTNHNDMFRFIRGIIKKGEMSEISRAFLHSAARAELVENVIKPALSEGRTVLSDRSYISFLVYQGYLRGQNIGSLKVMIDLAMQGIQIDYLFILTASPEICQKRINNRSENSQYDVVEREGIKTLKKINLAYERLVQTLGAHQIDASKKVQDVHEQIVQILISKGE